MLNKLNEIISFNSEFKNSINLYLNLNKNNKIKSYIPTKSSITILNRYLHSVDENKNQSTLLIGPYGKGKSHLLLVIIAILSMDRNKDNNILVKELTAKVRKIDKESSNLIDNIWQTKGKFLPIVIMSTTGDLNQAFLMGINEALKREGLEDITPNTYFSHAIDTISRWEIEYDTTYSEYLSILKARTIAPSDMISDLTNCKKESLEIFKEIYPKLTAGSVFNPLVSAEVLPMYKSFSNKLKEEYGYSGIYIVFDEFSKFIEGQEKKAMGNNMKLLQDMCELANESKESQIFITMVTHKSIKEYGKYLSSETINSFTGIEGRIEEVHFETSSKNNYELVQNAIFKNDVDLEKIPQKDKYFSPEIVGEFYEISAFKSIFTREDFEKIVVRGCFPLSPTSAYILLNISEKVAQNERTLFTFISKDEPNSMAKYVKEHPSKDGEEWIINAYLIYDYFKNLFKKDISNEFIHNEWLNAEYAISQTNDLNEIKVLKSLATIIIVNKTDELPPDNKHLKLVAGIDDVSIVLEELEKKKLIYKKGSTNLYAFKTRAGSELKKEIKRRRQINGNNINIGKVLSIISDLKYVLPKQYNQEYSMTRYFRYEFMDVAEFLEIEDSNVFFENEKFCDGKIIVLFSKNPGNEEKEIKNKVEKYRNKKLVIVYSDNKFDLIKQAQDYQSIQQLKLDVEFLKENGVLLKEIPIFEEDLEKEIEKYIEGAFGKNGEYKTFYYLKDILYEKKSLSINRVVNEICMNYYDKPMIINNELINREFVTSSVIKKVRKTIINSLLAKENAECFFESRSVTSAEATIYRALFINTGISSNEYNHSTGLVMSIFDEFILSCGKEKKELSLLIKQLISAPIGLRKGIIPIYLSYAISKRNEDIIVYYNNKEVPLSADSILNMCENPLEYFIYISLEDILKEKYINDLSELFNIKNATNLSESRINNILICMQRWYRSLPQTTKNIKRKNENISLEIEPSSFSIVKGIFQKIDINPYEAIFVSIPEALACKNEFDKCVSYLKIIKKEMDEYLDRLIQKNIQKTIEVFDRKSKDDLNHTLKNWFFKQSDMAKEGLYDAQITGLMSYIAELNSYNDEEIIKKIVKIILGIYIDSWNDNSMFEYIEKLIIVKQDIESIKDKGSQGKFHLEFTGKKGTVITKYYNQVDESTGSQLRDILEDTMEDFSELTVNEKVAILLEMIEEIMG